MHRYFSLVRRIVMVIIIAGGLIAVGVFMGRKYATPVPSATMHPYPLQAAVTPTVIPQVSPTVVSATRVSITGGGVKPFFTYTLSAFSDWTVAKSQTGAQDKLTLTKGEYQITLIQGAFGGGSCMFPGDTPAAMSMSLTGPVDITLLTGKVFRRGEAASPTANQASYVVCQKGTDGQYTTFTDFGAINYVTPLHPDVTMISQMDAMIASLQK